MSAPTPPPVVRWYRRYLMATAALYLAVASLGVVGLVRAVRMAERLGVDVATMRVLSMLWIVTLLFIGVVHGAAARTPRAPWAWTIIAVVLGLDLTTLVLWPFALPLLWMWLKSDTRAWFGRG